MMDVCVLVMLVVIFSPLTLHLSSRKEVLAGSKAGSVKGTDAGFAGDRCRG